MSVTFIINCTNDMPIINNSIFVDIDKLSTLELHKDIITNLATERDGIIMFEIYKGLFDNKNIILPATKLMIKNKLIIEQVVKSYIDHLNVNIFMIGEDKNILKRVNELRWNIINNIVDTSNIIPEKFKFIQHRILASYTLDKLYVHHITWEYNQNGIIYKNNNLNPNECDAELLELDGCSLLVINYAPIKEFAHITVNPGTHAPASMKDIAIAYNKNETTISIPSKNKKEMIMYDLSNIKKTSTKVILHCEFYMNY